MVDIGSNSVRLFQVASVKDGLPEGPRETHVVGLKRNANPDGTLATDALERLERCLGLLGETVARSALPDSFVVGTSAVRDAPNRTKVADAVRRAFGTELVVLSGTREAELSYRGARLTQPQGAVAVLDVGGASTEIAVGVGDTPTAVSVNVGGVRCGGGPIGEDPPAPGSAEALRTAIRELMSEAVSGLPEHQMLVGVAGTVTSLAAIEIGRYDPVLVHGHTLRRDRLSDLMVRLAAMTLHERRQVPGLDPERAPVIVVGAAIVLAAMDALHAEVLTVSERDLLDGVAASVLEGNFRIGGEIS